MGYKKRLIEIRPILLQFLLRYLTAFSSLLAWMRSHCKFLNMSLQKHWNMILEQICGTFLLLQFFVLQLPTFSSLPAWMRSHWELLTVFEALPRDQTSFSLSVPRRPARRYNMEIRDMKETMRKWPRDNHQSDYKDNFTKLFLLRLFTVMSACMGSVPDTLAIASLQFLLVPYSLFTCFGYFIVLIPGIYCLLYTSPSPRDS